MAGYLTTGEAAAELGVHPNTLRNWARQGLVQPVWRTPRRGDARWDLDNLQQQLAALGQGQTGERAAAVQQASKPQPPAVIAAIVTSRLGVLLVQRRDGTPPWSFPAGESEPGESPEDTAVREVKEETGLLIKAGRVITERMHPQTGRHMVYLAGRPAIHNRDVHVGDEDELTDVRWCTRREAEDLMPSMAPAVHQYLVEHMTGGRVRGSRSAPAA